MPSLLDSLRSLPRAFARIPEWLGRVAGLVFFLGVVAWRASLYSVPGTWLPLWAAETGVYVLIVIAYLRRSPALERASTWPEILLPAIGGPFPFLLLRSEVHPLGDQRAHVALIFGGALLVVVAYAYLGGSFAILVEARPLRDRGPYRLVRHPVYLGQLLSTLGVALVRFSPANVALWLGFLTVQILRARLEETKLTRATPGYAEYRARTWMLLPFIV